MRSLLLLLLAAELLLASTVVVTYVVKPDGKTVTSVKLRDVLINSGPAPLNISGVLLPPYSAAVLEQAVGNVYPPFLALDVGLRYINGTLSGGVLKADEDVVVELRLGLRALLPVSVPVIVSIPADDKLAILYETAPTTITQISGTTVYYWSLFVDNQAELRVRFRIRQFGSFGAVKMPTVSVVATLRINDTLAALEERARGLDAAYAQVSNFTEAVAVFTDAAYGQLRNLTQLIQILNLTGVALEQGAVALNTSTYALEALRMQIRALGDAASGVAETLNQSIVLVDYQYTALITAANLLEVQSSALSSYKTAADETLKSLRDTKEQLYVIRRNLLEARRSLDGAIRDVEEAKRRLSSLNVTVPEARQAVETSAALLDSAASRLYALRGAVDSLLSTVEALIAITDSAARTLETTSRSLGELAPLLNRTAASTRSNATVLRSDMPQIIRNATKNLQGVAQNLYKTGDEVTRFTIPLHNASATLADVGRRLKQNAAELDRFRIEQTKALPRLGAVLSAAQNYTYLINAQKREIEAQIEALRRYYAAVNASEMELQWFIELPVAVRNVTLSLTPVQLERSQRSNLVNIPTLLTLIVAITGAASAVMFALRRKGL
jgi:ABC-type transporter Mla subunit MlaD